MPVRASTVICLFLTVTLNAGSVFAGFMGHNAKGDFGLMSGTQLPPGFYAIPLYYRYDGDSIKGKDGESIQVDPEGGG